MQEIEDKLLSIPDGKARWKAIKSSDPLDAIVAAEEAIYRTKAYNSTSMHKKSKSVIGSAAVGGIIAGPAGAIVGAIYAADKNRKNN